MRFFEIVVSGAALISSAFAVTIDTYPTAGVEAGKTYTITYSPKDQAATFILRKGLSTDLQTVATVGTGSGGNFTWTVDKDLPNASNYALEVKQGDQINYSAQFPLTGGSTAAISSALSSASAALSSAASVASSIRSSAASAITSAASSASASASVVPSSGSNTTVSTATLSKSATPSASKPASTTGGGPPQSTGAASMLESSPLAIIFGAIAAFAFLN
jgi:hypothetical protein